MGCLNYLTLYLYLIKSPVSGIRGSLEIPLPSMVTCTVCTHDDTGCLLPPPPLVLVSVAQWGGWGDHQMFTPGYSGNNSHWGGCVLWSCENKDIPKTKRLTSLWPVRARSYSVRIIQVVSVQKGFQLSRMKYPWVWNLIFWIHCSHEMRVSQQDKSWELCFSWYRQLFVLRWPMTTRAKPLLNTALHYCHQFSVLLWPLEPSLLQMNLMM